MAFSKTVYENGDICLSDDKGSVWLRPDEAKTRILGFEVPEEYRGEELYETLISAAETDVLKRGQSRLVFDVPSTDKDIVKALSEAGYELSKSDGVIYVNTKELITSTGVEKSLRMKFPDVEAVSFSDLLSFQREEIVQLLEKYNYPADERRFERIDRNISAVAYDEKYEARAILMASCIEDEIIVELLMGFSTRKPQYTLAVCQKFAESLIEQSLAESYPRIVMLTINESVIPLLKRLINKEYKLVTIANVIHAETETEEGNVEIEEASAGEDEEFSFTSPYQRNINEKYIWMSKKKNR